MADDEETDLPSVALGTSWDTFFAQCDSRTREKSESPVKQNSNDFVSRMPYQKATCFGIAPLDNARYLRLMKCNQCNKILKHVGFAHHMRRRHLCNSYELNGNNSADEAPDFLLSPPYTSNSSSATSIYNKQPSTSTNPLSYVSEKKRDGLLLVLKRARAPSTSDKNHINNEKQSDDDELMVVEKEEDIEQSINEEDEKLMMGRQRRSSKSQRLSISRSSMSQNEDCVAFRTRHRQPESQYVELPTHTRHHPKIQQQLPIPKIMVSQSVKNNSVASNQDSVGSPNSVIILDDDSSNKNDEEGSSYGNDPVEFSFALPEHHETNCANDEISQSGPTTDATLSSRSSSIQSINAPPSKASRSSSKHDSPRMYNIMNVEKEQYVEEEHTPQSSSMDYQNDNSLPSSSSPEMPQLEREDLYAPDDGASDSNQETNIYPNNAAVSFPAGTLVFTPVHHHHPNQFHQQHQVYNGNHVHPVNTFVINPPTTSTVVNQQQQPANNNQNGQPITFFYNPATVSSEPPQQTSFTLNQQLLRQQQTRKRQRSEVTPIIRAQQQSTRRKMAVVGTQLKTTSIHPYYSQMDQQPPAPQRRRILVSTAMSAQQLARLQAQSKANNTHGANNRQTKLPPPIIISNPNSKRPNMLQQRNRNYSPVVMNCLNNRANSSPSSANSSSFSSNSSAKSVENSWLNNIQFSNEFLYYNEPSVQTQNMGDLWKSSKSFHSTLETRDQH